jgi:hypothetical protein
MTKDLARPFDLGPMPLGSEMESREVAHLSPALQIRAVSRKKI